MAKGIELALTLYSLTSEYVRGKLSFEECLKLAKDNGFEGIELVACQMVPEYPYPSEEWMNYFVELMDGLGLTPLCYSAYVDMGTRSDRDLTSEEIFNCTLNDMLIAKQLGFQFVRTQHAISPEVFRKMKPYCEKTGVRLAIEMHAPHNPEVPVWQEYLQIMAESDGLLGVVPDFGIFAERPHDLMIQQAIEDFGCSAGVVDRILSAFAEGVSLEEVKTQGLSAAETTFAEKVYANHSPAKLDWLDLLVPHTFYIHGKFWYLKDDEDDSGIPYSKIMKRLNELQYNGYIACEYEGHHFRPDVDTLEQLRRFKNLVSR